MTTFTTAIMNAKTMFTSRNTFHTEGRLGVDSQAFRSFLLEPQKTCASCVLLYVRPPLALDMYLTSKRYCD